MKKLLGLLSIVAFAFALTACATNSASTDESTANAPAQVKAAPQATNDYKAEMV